MTNVEDYLRLQYASGVSEYTWGDRAKNIATLLLRPVERRKAARLVAKGDRPLRLHLGCGNTYKAGWLNIDLARPGRTLDLKWDLRAGLPFSNQSVESIFSEHLFEHIPLPSVMILLKECRRVLAPDGVIRIGVPDLERYVRAYLGNDPIIDEVRPGRPTRAIAISEIFYFHNHRAAYDAETLCLLLTESGFSSAGQASFGRSSISPAPDSPNRQRETLYVEAIAS